MMDRIIVVIIGKIRGERLADKFKPSNPKEDTDGALAGFC